jgi:hypothetical protein
MKGKKYYFKHLVSNGKLLHVLDKQFSGVLYDHANKTYRLAAVRIKNKTCSVLKT